MNKILLLTLPLLITACTTYDVQRYMPYGVNSAPPAPRPVYVNGHYQQPYQQGYQQNRQQPNTYYTQPQYNESHHNHEYNEHHDNGKHKGQHKNKHHDDD